MEFHVHARARDDGLGVSARASWRAETRRAVRLSCSTIKQVRAFPFARVARFSLGLLARVLGSCATCGGWCFARGCGGAEKRARLFARAGINNASACRGWSFARHVEELKAKNIGICANTTRAKIFYSLSSSFLLSKRVPWIISNI